MRRRCCNPGLGDSIDPRSRAAQAEALHVQTVEREAARVATLTPEQKAAEQKAKEQFAQLLTLQSQAKAQLAVGNVTVAELPLNSVQESMRQLSLKGDFQAMHTMQPFTVHAWNENTPLGKYRFNIVNGKKIYVPFTDEEIERFVFNHVKGPYIIEPGAECDLEKVAQKFKEEQANNKKQFPNTDWRHVVPIYPGGYICKIYRPSAWVKWRHVAAVAVGIVAAIYLGPIIAEKAAALGGGEAGSTASTFTKIKDGANSVLNIVNKARSVDAIIKGELPPPPISIVGDSFREWAYLVAKDQIEKEAMELAAKEGQKYIAKKLTEAEEKKLREEIAAMQAELEKIEAANKAAQTIQPAAELPQPIKELQTTEVAKAADNAATLNTLLLLGIPAALFLLG